MYNKTIIEFRFCDIQNNQGLGKCNQPQPPASADYTCLDLDYSRYHKNLIQLLFIIKNVDYHHNLSLSLLLSLLNPLKTVIE